MIGFGDAKPTLFRVSRGEAVGRLSQAEHGRKGSRYKRVGHTRQFPSIRPSAHEKDTVDRRHWSTFKVTKQDKRTEQIACCDDPR